MSNSVRRSGFSIVELLVVISIIGILSTLLLVALNIVKVKARDLKRKADIGTIGRFLTSSCYLPDGGIGTYDLSDLIVEIRNKNEQFRQSVNLVFADPKSGKATKSNYYYTINADHKCIIYANLENDDEPITIQGIDFPTPGYGSGVVASSTSGWNGSNRYYQLGN